MTDENDILELKYLSKEMIENLTEREREVLNDKLGIDLDNTQAFIAVKNQFKETSTRIREIEEKALKILRKGGDDDPGKA